MAKTRELVDLNSVFADIAALNSQLETKYSILADAFDKLTDGAQFGGANNLPFIKYWCRVAAAHPEILAGDFPQAAFQERTPLYEKMVNVFKDSKTADAIIATPAANLSQDSMFFANAVYNAAKERSNNPVFKKIMQESPLIYKKSKADNGNDAPIVKKETVLSMPTL